MDISVKDVNQHEFTKAFLKKSGKLKVPEWADIVKLGRFNELSPYDEDWFYTRAGSSSSSGSESSGEDEGRGRGEGKKAEMTTTTPTSTPVVKMLSEDEMNSLGARILRAELMGEEDVARQLKAQLEQAQKAREGAQKSRAEVARGSRGEGKAEDDDDDGVVVLTRTGRDGMVRPLPEEFDRDRGVNKRKRKNSTEKADDEFQMDDVLLSQAARQQSGACNEEKERSKAVFEHRIVSSAMGKCQFCFSKIPKHLLIAIGTKVYLSLPAHRSLSPGHCLVVPMQHVSASTALDQDVWTEIQAFRKQLVQMFASQEQDVVFMETSMHLKHFPHMVLECIPLKREIGDLAPIYFKKAIQDVGPEWSNNKKVVDLSRKDIRHSVPKGFAYFCVDFGLQGGFAHVIEDVKTFTSYFGREIVGGMIDAEPALWRKPHREGFADQRRKVLQFQKWWKPFDLTFA